MLLSEKYLRWIGLGLLGGSILLGTFASLHYQQLELLVLPFGLILGLLTILNYRIIFYLLLASIPISLHLELGALSLDVPSEPLMLLLSGIFLIELLGGRFELSKRKVYPFHLLIIFLLIWTAFSTLISFHPVRSAKFLAAKIWYLIPFVFLAERLLDHPRQLKWAFWSFFTPLCLIIIWISFLHAQTGFSFEKAHRIVYPYFPNAVSYGATLTLFLPFAWFARKWYTPKSLPWYIIIAGIGLILIGSLLSFKRGTWLAVAMLPPIYLLMRMKWFTKAFWTSLVAAALVITFLLQNNTFYQYAPDYNKTIWHEGNFEAHIQATFTGTEISGMERFYRWVAAKNMVAARPLLGFGPSTFNQEYKQYADDAFRTYVSDNPEQSTTHNYFLMTLTEQGIIGGGLFIFLCLYMLLKANRLYHSLNSKELKIVAMAAVMGLSVIIFHSLLNELIEVDKTGSLFWLILLLIHKLEVWHEKSPQT